jgi:hypothetical protein
VFRLNMLVRIWTEIHNSRSVHLSVSKEFVNELTMHGMGNTNVDHYRHHHYHHLPLPWIRSFDLFRHTRVDNNVLDKQLRLTGKAFISSLVFGLDI